ncbi:MAG: rod shape-determining protein MreC [Candidatus Omnitrophica bacterium]|nr:rod shape-determining protein MreC [Candidatus Omnitrophota bacterium]
MRPKALVLFLVLAVLPLVISKVAVGFPETVRVFSYQTFKPVFQASDFFSDQCTGLFAQTKSFLFTYRQNKELQARLNELEIEVARLKEENKKIQRLGKFLPYLEQKSRSSLYAQIIFRSISFWEQTAVIDKGARHGVGKGMPVITPEGLVGKVGSAGNSSANVIFLTDASSRTSVLVQESRDIGLLCGEGKKLLRMSYIDLSATLKIGDTIVTSGMGGVYPKGIPVGKVEMVGKDPDGLHLYAQVKPFVAFSKLEEVLCWVKKPEGR